MNRPLLSLTLALALAAGATADLLIQKDGRETQGELLALEGPTLRFRDPAGKELAMPRGEVARVEIYRDLSGTTARTVDGIADPVLPEVLAYLADAGTYPSAGAVNLLLEHRVRFEKDWSRVTTVRNVVRVLQERGKGEGTVQGSFLRDLDSFRFDFGRTYMPDGAVRGLTDKGVRVSAVNTAHPEYDRLMRQLQTLPAVDVGRVVDWQYTVTRKNDDPTLPPWYRHVIRLGEPVMRGVLEVRLHRDLKADVVLTRTEGVARSRRWDGDYRVERFEYSGLEPGKREDRRPPGSEIFPTVYVAPQGTWEQISESLRPLVEEASKPGPLARELVKKLLPKKVSADQAYQTLALWVAREVRLVGVVMANFRYAPRPVEEVLASRKGNYLDKTLALHGLLRAAGVESELYLSRDRYLSPLPGGVRSLHLFNDALVRVKLSSGWVFRTPDDEDLDPHVLPSAFYDTAALRVSGEAPAKAPTRVEPPAMEADRARVRYRTRLLADGTLEGERDLLVRGNSATTVRAYRNLSGEQLKKRMEKLNHSFHPSAQLVSYELEHLADFTRDPIYRRRFRIPGYALKAGGKLLAFRLPGLVDSSSDVGSPVRRFPLAFMDRELRETEIEVELPKGARVLHVPGDLTLSGDGYLYTGRFGKANGRITYRGHSSRETFRIPPEGYPAYKAMRDARARLARQWVVVEMVD